MSRGRDVPMSLCRRGNQTHKTEERMTETTTEDLARFAASVKYENIPAPAREYCKDILLDTLACAFAGHFGEETDQIARFAKSLATSTAVSYTHLTLPT